jgi:hypothetical protein
MLSGFIVNGSVQAFHQPAEQASSRELTLVSRVALHLSAQIRTVGDLFGLPETL